MLVYRGGALALFVLCLSPFPPPICIRFVFFFFLFVGCLVHRPVHRPRPLPPFSSTSSASLSFSFFRCVVHRHNFLVVFAVHCGGDVLRSTLSLPLSVHWSAHPPSTWRRLSGL